MTRVLHVLTQRPGRTGSGVTLDAIVRDTERVGGWQQHVLVGVPVDDPAPDVGGLSAERVEAVRFGPGGDLPFPVPGMSDVMPYESTVFGSLTGDELARYEAVWRDRIRRAVDASGAQLVHVHHVWLVGALAKDAAGDLPVVGHCHATGLRQMELVPRLAERVRIGNARNDRHAVLHPEHRTRLASTLGIDAARITVVGAGFREDVFGAREAVADRSPSRIVYAGKLSASKGVFALLDAFEALHRTRPDVVLEVTGGGTGEEADALRDRMESLAPAVRYHGFVQTGELAELLTTAAVFVLPSYYEGLPLALVEAAASGCRLVATTTPGVRDVLAPKLGSALHAVELPALLSIDAPDPKAVPAFVDRLTDALAAALDAGPVERVDLSAFRWSAVAERVRAIWSSLLRD